MLKSRSGWTVNVTKPSLPVVRSGGVVVTTGVERRKTSAPLTFRPRVSSTRTRTVNAAKRERSRFGENCTRSISSRSGGFTEVTGTVLPGPGAAVTGLVAAESAEAEPLAFAFVTRERRVLPTSAAWTVYDCAVAPGIATQLLPPALQRNH